MADNVHPRLGAASQVLQPRAMVDGVEAHESACAFMPMHPFFEVRGITSFRYLMLECIVLDRSHRRLKGGDDVSEGAAAFMNLIPSGKVRIHDDLLSSVCNACICTQFTKHVHVRASIKAPRSSGVSKMIEARPGRGKEEQDE